MADRVSKPRRIFFARAVDADNLNAQAGNTREILARWGSEEWRPTVVSFRAPDTRVAANPRVDIVRIPPDRWWRARLWRLYQDSFDAIFYPGLHHRADYLALRTRALTGRRIPVIATVEELAGNESDRRLFAAAAGHPVFCHDLDEAVYARYQRVRRDADSLIAISPFLARMARVKYGEKVNSLALGVDTVLFRRESWDPAERKIVVTAGKVAAHKRPAKFLALARRFPEAVFRWFGEGPLRAEMSDEAQRLGIGNVFFPGAVPSEILAREFSAANIFVLPSWAEGVPKVTQEAAASGLAQIVFGFFEAPTVVDGLNGCVVWNDRSFEDKLAELLANPDLVEQMGRAGHRLAKGWVWDSIAPLWEQRIIDCAEGALARGDCGRFGTMRRKGIGLRDG